MLIDLGLGVVEDGSDTAWQVFSSDEPTSPDKTITVFDDVGIEDGRSMIDGRRFQHEGVTISIRAAEPVAGFHKAITIAETLATGVYKKVVALDEGRYLVWSFNQTGTVRAAGKDRPSSERNLWTVVGTLVITRLN